MRKKKLRIKTGSECFLKPNSLVQVKMHPNFGKKKLKSFSPKKKLFQIGSRITQNYKKKTKGIRIKRGKIIFCARNRT